MSKEKETGIIKRATRKTIEGIIIELLKEYNDSGLDEEQLLNYTACLAGRRGEVLPYFEYNKVKDRLEEQGRIEVREIEVQKILYKSHTSSLGKKRFFLRE